MNNDIKNIHQYIIDCAIDEDDIGNAAINTSLLFDITINNFLKIIENLMLNKNIGIYYYENEIIVEGSIRNLKELFIKNRYKTFLYVL